MTVSHISRWGVLAYVKQVDAWLHGALQCSLGQRVHSCHVCCILVWCNPLLLKDTLRPDHLNMHCTPTGYIAVSGWLSIIYTCTPQAL